MGANITMYTVTQLLVIQGPCKVGLAVIIAPIPLHIFKLSKNLISARFIEAEILADVFSEDDSYSFAEITKNYFKDFQKRKRWIHNILP